VICQEDSSGIYKLTFQKLMLQEDGTWQMIPSVIVNSDSYFCSFVRIMKHDDYRLLVGYSNGQLEERDLENLEIRQTQQTQTLQQIIGKKRKREMNGNSTNTTTTSTLTKNNSLSGLTLNSSGSFSLTNTTTNPNKLLISLEQMGTDATLAVPVGVSSTPFGLFRCVLYLQNHEPILVIENIPALNFVDENDTSAFVSNMAIAYKAMTIDQEPNFQTSIENQSSPMQPVSMWEFLEYLRVFRIREIQAQEQTLLLQNNQQQTQEKPQSNTFTNVMLFVENSLKSVVKGNTRETVSGVG